jgi:hypothetical protein
VTGALLVITLAVCSGGAFPHAANGEPGQAAAHLLIVIEIEVLAHVCRPVVTLPACFQGIPEGMLITTRAIRWARQETFYLPSRGIWVDSGR